MSIAVILAASAVGAVVGLISLRLGGDRPDRNAEEHFRGGLDHDYSDLLHNSGHCFDNDMVPIGEPMLDLLPTSSIESSLATTTINPASGLPMLDGMGGLDVAGNAFGTSHDTFDIGGCTQSSGSDDLFGSSCASFSDSFSSSCDSFSSSFGCGSDW